MKNSLNRYSKLAIISLFLLGSCNKVGPGGTSSVQGKITGAEYSEPRTEITEVIISNGSQVEHGDYWVFNSTDTSHYYYVWYNNPTWVINGDPQLNGRTGIEVSFNYSDSNTEVAQNTLTAIQNLASEITVELINDILRITNINAGDVPDADKVNSPFEVNISQQGRDSDWGDSVGLVDEKVYISYGNNVLYDDQIRSGENGTFSFNGLTKGQYTVFCFSTDTVNFQQIKKEVSVEITSKKSVVDVGTIDIIK